MLFDGTYSLDDFLLFSEEVYWRLFEVHNAAFWPLVPLAAISSVLLLYPWLFGTDRQRRITVLAAAAAWFCVSYAFFWLSYATINWAAVYLVPLFVAEGLLLLLLAARQRPWTVSLKTGPGAAGTTLMLYGFVLYPLQGLAVGRRLEAVQLFGLAPDPTALATLGFLIAGGRGWLARTCLIAPVVWCLLSATTLYALGSWEAWPLAAAALFSLILCPLMRGTKGAAGL